MCNTVLQLKLTNMQSTLNTEKFSSAIKSKRGKKGLRETAAEIGGVSAATLSRIEQGNLPDVETFIKICKWLKVSTDSFILGKKPSNSELSEKDKIVYQLRSSRELDVATVNAMIALVNAAFNKKP
jgi:transcriptional regulator with XRE-family HTH domain